MEFVHFGDLYIFLIFSLCPCIIGAPLQCPNSNLSIVGGNFTLTKNYNEGSVLDYICPDGFYPYPNRKLVCSQGSWNPNTKHRRECKQITCPNPKVLENGVVEPNKPQYVMNDITSYKCQSDYTFRGSATRTCQRNGKWSGSTPICSYDSDHCPDPGIPPGASRQGHIFDIGDDVIYTCDKPLRLVGSEERVCQDDRTWSGKAPECYAQFTYDTPEEIAEAFGSSLKITLTGYDETKQFQKRIRLDQNGPLDIYIALDTSESIEEKDFKDAKKIIIKLIEKISDYDVNPNYEIIIFATEIHKVQKGKDLTSLIKNVKDFKFVGKRQKTGTDIANVYRNITETLSFKKANNKVKFMSTQHVVIMFTDGIYNMGGNPKRYVDEIKQLVYEGKENRENYLDLYLFRVGDSEEKSVNEWVTKKPNEQHLFLPTNYENLDQTLDEMIDEGNRVGQCGHYRSYGDDNTDSEKRPKYPWLVEMFVTNEKTRKCLGSLVTPRFVLTAAHCFKSDEVEKIDLDVLTFKELKEPLKVKDYIIHPKFDVKQKNYINETYLYDVALIELKEEVKPSVYLRPICIPCTEETSKALRLTGGEVTCKQHKEELLKGNEVKAFFMSTKGTPFVKKAHIRVGENEKSKCITMTEKVLKLSKSDATDLIKNNFLCTGGELATDVDDFTCKGDSGGATYLANNRLIQVGIVSWGLKDLCAKGGNADETKDFHIDLFNPEVQTFLEKYLSDGRRGQPLTFIK